MAIEKPRSLREQAMVDAELQRKYPQMQSKKWKKRVAKAKQPAGESAVEQVKEAKKNQKTALESALTGDEIKRLMGR